MWVVVGILLALGCIGLVGLNASGVPASDLLIGESPARDGQNVLAAHFPGGSGQPVQVIVPQAKLGEAATVALDNAGVSGASVVSADSPSGSIPIPTPAEGPFAQATPTVVDGDVMLQLTLAAKADSLEAEQTVTDLRTALRSVDSSIVVGGSTAIDLDTNLTSTRDRNLIIPVVLVVITLILMLLLRSIVAPLLLMVTTLLSFGTALGVSSLIFNHLLDFPGADPSVPLYGFVFLVALGIDYNIFLMTRVREESPGARDQGGRAARTRGHRWRDHLGRRRAGRDLCRPGRDPDPVPGSARRHRRLRRLARRVGGARPVRAGVGARRRRPGLVALEARSAQRFLRARP